MKHYVSTKKQPLGYHFWTTSYEEFQVIVVLRGALEFLADRDVTLVRAGGAVVLPYGSAFSLACREQSYEGIGAGFRGSPAEADARFHGQALARPLTPESAELAARVEAEIEASRFGAGAICEHLGRAIEELGVRELRAPESDASDAQYWAEQAQFAIRSNLHTNAPVEQIVAGLGISYRQLSRHFQVVSGVSLKRFQLDCKINEACSLLRNTRRSLTDIAYELGFSSSQHFSSAFTSRTGTSPSAFRRSAGLGVTG